MSNEIRFSTLQYMKTFLMFGWIQELAKENKNPDASFVWMVFINWVGDNVEQISIEHITSGEFYYDYPIGNIERIREDFQMSKPTFGKALNTLIEAGLVRKSKGANNAGISRLYFPISIPEPSVLRIPKHFSLKHSGNIDYQIKKRTQFQRDIIAYKKDKDYKNEDITKYKLLLNDYLQDKRIKLQEQYIILLAKNEVEVHKDFIRNEACERITKMIQQYVYPFMVEIAISNLYERKEKIDYVFRELKKELTRLKNENQKTKAYAEEDNYMSDNFANDLFKTIQESEDNEIKIIEEEINNFDHINGSHENYRLLKKMLKEAKNKQFNNIYVDTEELIIDIEKELEEKSRTVEDYEYLYTDTD